jgi:hypothetical protein
MVHQSFYHGQGYGQLCYGGSSFDGFHPFHNNSASIHQISYNYGNSEFPQRSIVPFTYGYYEDGPCLPTNAAENSRAPSLNGLQARDGGLDLSSNWARRNLSNVSFESDVSTCSTLTDRSISDSSASPPQHGDIKSLPSEYGDDPDDIKAIRQNFSKPKTNNDGVCDDRADEHSEPEETEGSELSSDDDFNI